MKLSNSLVNSFGVSLVSLAVIMVFISLNSSFFHPLSAINDLFLFDSVGFWMSYLTLFLGSCIVFFMLTVPISIHSMMFLVFVSLLVFLTSNFLFLYVAFELSLVPISFIILKWGSYSNRSSSVEYMLLYTVFFSFPLLLVVFYYFGASNFPSLVAGLVMGNSMFPCPLWVSLLVMFSFMVKLPVYGLHYWLPQAHVEAPTFGSMILAGVLLKLGGYGLYRTCSLFPSADYILWVLGSYLLVSLLWISVVTTFQSDFKRLVAYSSVVHMSPMPIILFFSNSVSTATLNMVLVFHGIASPLLFFFVGMVYLYSGSRNLVYVRSSLVVMPFISALLTFVFLISVPTPPFPGFFSELLLLTNLVINFKMGAVFVFFVVVFSLVYNLMWYLPSVVLSTYSAAPSVSIISGPSLSLVVNPCALVLFMCSLIFMLNTF